MTHKPQSTETPRFMMEVRKVTMLVNLAVHKFCCKTGWSKDYPGASDKVVIWNDDHPKEYNRKMTSGKVSSHGVT